MIIFSATKQMNQSKQFEKYNFRPEQEKILNVILAKSKEDLAKFYKIKNKTLDTTFAYFHSQPIINRAINAYQGISYKQITSFKNLEDLYIMSAFYGIVRSDELIANYRLDFTNKIFNDISLYDYHSNYITKRINENKDEYILNLCSEEYFKAYKNLAINKKIINVSVNGNKPNSVFLKKMRGQLLDYVLSNNIKDYSLIDDFENELFTASYINEEIIIEFKE